MSISVKPKPRVINAMLFYLSSVLPLSYSQCSTSHSISIKCTHNFLPGSLHTIRLWTRDNWPKGFYAARVIPSEPKVIVRTVVYSPITHNSVKAKLSQSNECQVKTDKIQRSLTVRRNGDRIFQVFFLSKLNAKNQLVREYLSKRTEN